MGIDILNSALTPSVSLCSSFSLHLPWFFLLFFFFKLAFFMHKACFIRFLPKAVAGEAEGSTDFLWLSIGTEGSFHLLIILLSQKPRVLLFS